MQELGQVLGDLWSTWGGDALTLLIPETGKKTTSGKLAREIIKGTIAEGLNQITEEGKRIRSGDTGTGTLSIKDAPPAVRKQIKQRLDGIIADEPPGLSLVHVTTSPEFIEEIVNMGADVNKQTVTTGETALHYAAHAGDRERAETLLKLGAKQIPDYTGSTPLSDAVRYGHENVAQLIVKHEMDNGRPPDTNERVPMAAVATQAENGVLPEETIMHVAVRRGYERTLEALIDAFRAYERSKGRTGDLVRVLNGKNETLMHTAAQVGTGGVMEILVNADESGAMIGKRDANGRTPLDAVQLRDDDYTKQVVRAMLKRHAEKKLGKSKIANAAA